MSKNLIQSVSENAERLEERTGSGVWDSMRSYGFGGFLRESVEHQATTIMRITNFVKRLCLFHGVSIPFSVQFQSALATANQQWSADGKSALISLGATPLDNPSHTMEDILELYSGYALHEAEHILTTPRRDWQSYVTQSELDVEDAKRRGSSTELMMVEADKVFTQLLEDVRIEGALIARSPGFDVYLHRMHKFLFGSELERVKGIWEELSDRSKFLAVVQFALRYPSHVPKEMKEWSVKGISPFKVLSEVPDQLESFADVRDLSKKLCGVLKGLEDPPEEKTPEDALAEATEGLGDEMGMSEEDMESDESDDSADSGDASDVGNAGDSEEAVDEDSDEQRSQGSGENTSENEEGEDGTTNDSTGDGGSGDDQEDEHEDGSDGKGDGDETPDASGEGGEEGPDNAGDDSQSGDSEEAGQDDGSGKPSETPAEDMDDSGSDGGGEADGEDEEADSEDGGDSGTGDGSDSQDDSGGVDDRDDKDAAGSPDGSEGDSPANDGTGECADNRMDSGDGGRERPHEDATGPDGDADESDGEAGDPESGEAGDGSGEGEDSGSVDGEELDEVGDGEAGGADGDSGGAGEGEGKDESDRIVDEAIEDAALIEGRLREESLKEDLIDPEKLKQIAESSDLTSEQKHDLIEELKAAEKHIPPVVPEPTEPSKTFGLSDMLKMAGKMTEKGISAGVIEELEKLTDEHFESDDHWVKGDPLFGSRSVAVKQPRLTEDCEVRYDAAARIVAPFVRKAGTIFRLRRAINTVRSVDKREGKLFRRRLAFAKSPDVRPFYREKTTHAQGISVCMLLDESGSMGYVDNAELIALANKGSTDGGDLSNASQVLCMAVMMQRALLKVPKVDLQIYAHESYGSGDRDCMIKLLYGGGRSPKEIKGVGGYCSGDQNYDHVALRITGMKFKETAKYKKQLLFYLADGEPAGHAYGGPSARNATKKEVRDLEKDGMFVVCMGVGGHDPSDMFKHHIRFNGDFGELIEKVKALISKEVLKAGYGDEE